MLVIDGFSVLALPFFWCLPLCFYAMFLVMFFGNVYEVADGCAG